MMARQEGSTSPYIVASDGNQAFFDLTRGCEQLVMAPIPAYFPCVYSAGKLWCGGYLSLRLWRRMVPLVEQRRPRYVAEATLETPSFDSGERTAASVRADACTRQERTCSVEPGCEPGRGCRVLPGQEPPLYLRGDG
jgi:hypothetical protein